MSWSKAQLESDGLINPCALSLAACWILLPSCWSPAAVLLAPQGRTEQAENVLGKVMRWCGKEMPEGRLQPLLVDNSQDPLDEQQQGQGGR